MDIWAAEFGDSFANRRVLVTGATGFLDGHLCWALDGLGARLAGLARSGDWSTLPAGIERLEVDLTSAKATTAALKRFAPDLVFHTAGLVTTRLAVDLLLPMIDNNLVATAHLLLAVRDAGCARFVHLGTSEEGDPSQSFDPSTSPYAVSKQAASQMVRMFAAHFGLAGVVVRPVLTFGPRQPTDKLIPHCIHSLLHGRPPQIRTPSRRYEFIFVEDVVRGLLAAGSVPDADGRVMTLGTGQPMTIARVVEEIADLVSARGAQRSMSDAVHRPARPPASLTAWSPVWSLRDGLAETIRWYRENG